MYSVEHLLKLDVQVLSLLSFHIDLDDNVKDDDDKDDDDSDNSVHLFIEC